MDSEWKVDENFILMLPKEGVAKRIYNTSVSSNPLSMEEIKDLVKQIDYYKPTYTKIRINEVFLSEMVKLGIIQYGTDITRIGLKMEIDNSVV